MPETDPTPTAPESAAAAPAAPALFVGDPAVVAALRARAEAAERDLARDREGLVELMHDRDRIAAELAAAQAEVERLSRPTVVTTIPTQPVLSEQARRQQRAEALLASLDAMPAAREHTPAEARCARALWAAETRGTTVPDWEGLEVPQRHAVVSHARTFLNSDEPAAVLARELLGA